MTAFNYRDGELHAEGVPLRTLAQAFGTPTYVYSRAAIEERFRSYTAALTGRSHLICYAVKANSNLAVLNVLAQLGAGFDIVSGGELQRVIAAGGDPAKVVFSGVGKTHQEMREALAAGIHCFNVESSAELERLNDVAGEFGQRAPVSLRVNPDVDAQTHPYISTGLKENKFGIPIDEAPAVYRRARELPHIEIRGVDCHIGSQLTQTAPFLDALGRVLALIDELAADGITVDHLDLGGGLGVRYRDEQPPEPNAYVEAVLRVLGDRPVKLIFEPGRSIVANAGLLLTTVEYLKCGEHKNFCVVDAAMNDLIRPALYDAWMAIQPVAEQSDAPRRTFDVVGPVCETGDFLGKERELAVAPGDLLAVMSAGAYGFGMSSNYNSRPRAAEVMVDGDRFHLVRARETFADLIRGESVLA
ncbi:MAG: diaminopimelate decarboxylase [Spongiibacteraceae bacterium]|jgi:diaminopimelate decarboxylase|nr:diaminopimelate decarboxylase [Spongiibacteraceae bacterium]